MLDLDVLFSFLRRALPYEDADLTVPRRGDVTDWPDSMWLDVPGGDPPVRYVRVGTMTITFDNRGQIAGCGRWIYRPAHLTTVGRLNDAMRRGLAPDPDDLSEIFPPSLSHRARQHILESVGAPPAKRGTQAYAEKVFAAAILVNARNRGLSEQAACDHVRTVIGRKHENRVIHRWRREADNKFGMESGEWYQMPYPVQCW